MLSSRVLADKGVGAVGLESWGYVPGNEPRTPKRVVKPTIVYPLSPGGTEIKPPDNTPPASPQVPVPDSAMAQGSEIENRRKYTPEDKVWWTVPKLGEPDGEAVIKAGDWLVQLEVVMGDLCEGSGEWWARIVACARVPMIGGLRLLL